MFEATLLSVVALLLLAAASHRFRRGAGVTRARDASMLRIAGSLIFVVAFMRSGTSLSGERIVRFVCAASIGGTCVVLLLSSISAILFRPLRWVLRRPDDA